MKIAATIVRILMGLVFTAGAVAVLFDLAPQPELTGNLKTFFEGITATGYLMTLIKVTELVCGIAFLSGRFVPLACVLISPVIVNIFLLNIFLDRSGLPLSIFLVLANSFLAYAHWDKFRPMLAAK